MEYLSSSMFVSRFPETYPVINTPSSSSPSPSSSIINRIGSLKFAEIARFPGFRCRAITCEVSGGEGEEQRPLNNGFSFLYDDFLSLPQDNLKEYQSSEKDAEKIVKVETVQQGSGTGGGARAGLFRTPISGGVQSATSAHGLPLPALAVRNLMEQARFAHLCTVMSRMHHRREGYPFGSLVDFAPDSMGHPIFSFSPLAIHTRNLLADPRCMLVVQIPGWSSLSNARVTIFGDVFPLSEHEQEGTHKQYIAKHQQGPSQ